MTKSFQEYLDSEEVAALDTKRKNELDGLIKTAGSWLNADDLDTFNELVDYRFYNTSRGKKSEEAHRKSAIKETILNLSDVGALQFA